MSAITCEWGLEKQRDANGPGPENSLRDFEQASGLVLQARWRTKRIKIDKSRPLLVSSYVQPPMELWSLLFYGVCKNVWNDRDSSWIGAERRYLHLCVCVCVRTFSVQKRFSRDFLAVLCVSVAIVFKNLLFSLFEYVNFPLIVMQSHLVSPSPNCCQICFSHFLFFVFKERKTSGMGQILPTGLFCVV